MVHLVAKKLDLPEDVVASDIVTLMAPPANRPPHHPDAVDGPLEASPGTLESHPERF